MLHENAEGLGGGYEASCVLQTLADCTHHHLPIQSCERSQQHQVCTTASYDASLLSGLAQAVTVTLAHGTPYAYGRSASQFAVFTSVDDSGPALV